MLVYGPGVKGNMAELMRLARSRLPLPFGGLTARRSLLSLDNLVEAVDCVLSAPAPLRRPLMVADPEPLTLPEMVAAIRRGLGRRPGLVPVPSAMLAAACRVAGRDEAYRRLAGSLVADPAALRQLGWAPVGRHTGGLGSADAMIARTEPRRHNRLRKAAIRAETGHVKRSCAIIAW